MGQPDRFVACAVINPASEFKQSPDADSFIIEMLPVIWNQIGGIVRPQVLQKRRNVFRFVTWISSRDHGGEFHDQHLGQEDRKALDALLKLWSWRVYERKAPLSVCPARSSHRS
jgi:hypothetical protein